MIDVKMTIPELRNLLGVQEKLIQAQRDLIKAFQEHDKNMPKYEDGPLAAIQAFPQEWKSQHDGRIEL